MAGDYDLWGTAEPLAAAIRAAINDFGPSDGLQKAAALILVTKGLQDQVARKVGPDEADNAATRLETAVADALVSLIEHYGPPRR